MAAFLNAVAHLIFLVLTVAALLFFGPVSLLITMPLWILAAIDAAAARRRREHRELMAKLEELK